MAFEFRNLDESTIDAVEPVIAERFCPEAFAQVRRLLKNPARTAGDDVGVVVFDGERVVGVTGSIVRRLYVGSDGFVGINGGFLAMRRDAPATLLYGLLKQAHRPRFGSSLFYSNTCSPATVKMKPCVGVGNHGPDSWSAVRFARLRRYPSFRRRVKRGLGIGLPERLPFSAAPVSPLECVRTRRRFAADEASGLVVTACSDFEWADLFFDMYLLGNKGVVGSRSTAELMWCFGDAVSSGTGLALVAESSEGVMGYLVAAPCPFDASRWSVVDAIALRNDRKTLSLLFEAAKKAVLACSAAERLEVIGFPAWIQREIARAFPLSRPTPCNGFMWGFSDADMSKKCGDLTDSEKGWFFGPYDGDHCLCVQ